MNSLMFMSTLACLDFMRVSENLSSDKKRQASISMTCMAKVSLEPIKITSLSENLVM